MRKILFLAIAIFLSIQNTMAWNGKGHEVVAYIAYQHLDNGTRTKVDSLLSKNPCFAEWQKAASGLPAEQQSAAIFMQAATWPDMIKLDSYDCQPGHSFGPDGPNGGDTAPSGPAASQNIGYDDTHRHKYWHFVDEPFSTDATPTTPPPSPNALDEIKALAAALASNETDDIKSYDLVWIEHLVGDIHQPLHATSRFTRNHPHGDEGGNLVLICDTPDCKSELHAYWDDILGPQDLNAALRMGAQLNSRAEPAGAGDQNVNDWVQESFQLAKTNIYRSPISDDEPDSPVGVPDRAYQMQAKTVAQSQVLLAGYRLAGLLNQVLAAHQ